MDPAALVARMEAFPAALAALLAPLDADAWRWRPPEGGWSILEVVNHLADEEVEDFGARLRRVLDDPAAEWPPIDPEGAVAARAYQQRDPAESLARWTAERARTIAWLRGLRAPRWESFRAHPRAPGGGLHAGDLLAAWAAHDARHLQQVAKRLHGLAARDGAPYSTGYAG